MGVLYLSGGHAVLPDRVEPCTVRIEDGTLSLMDSEAKIPSECEHIDITGLHILPGFIDLHVHGGGGHDFMDLSEDSFAEIVSTHAYHGTTAIMPTALTASTESIEAFLQLYRSMQSRTLSAALLGVHLEGPFLSPKQTGAQNASMLQLPTVENIAYLKNYADIIKRIDIAPELPGALQAGKYFADHGAIVSIGHSDALYDTVVEAVRYGFSHVTHLHCAAPWARKIEERVQAGIPEAAYLHDEIRFELIGDGLHIAPQTIEMAVQFKPRYAVSLVTDAMRAAATVASESYLGAVSPENRVIIEGGVAKLPDRSSFAGSIATMDRVFFTTLRTTSLPIWKVCELTSAAAAVLLGIEARKGSIADGKDADLVICDLAAEEIRFVISGGNIIRKPS